MLSSDLLFATQSSEQSYQQFYKQVRKRATASLVDAQIPMNIRRAEAARIITLTIRIPNCIESLT
eukprot:m.358340 g.358340  ORF g.358340 m.358340 type:complete len:65 (-) comp18115_c0_seq1:1609-1803(-)